MITRRHLVLTSILLATEAPLARAEPAATDDPVAIINAIYARVTKDKNHEGAFVWANKAAKAKYLTRSLITLWTKADARVPKGDIGPIDFDPITNSQDPDVASFKVEAEKLDAGKALIAVTLIGQTRRKTQADEVIRYEFVREPMGWKIDDIKSSVDGKPWSVRAMLSLSLKS